MVYILLSGWWALIYFEVKEVILEIYFEVKEDG